MGLTQFCDSCFWNEFDLWRSDVDWKRTISTNNLPINGHSAWCITSRLIVGLECKIFISIQNRGPRYETTLIQSFIAIDSIFIFVNCWRSKFRGNTWYIFRTIALHYLTWIFHRVVSELPARKSAQNTTVTVFLIGIFAIFHWHEYPEADCDNTSKDRTFMSPRISGKQSST